MADQDTSSDALFDFVAWLETHRLRAICYLGVFLIALFGIYFYKFNQRMGEEEGLAALVNAQTNRQADVPGESGGYTRALRGVQRDYPRTQAAQRAGLMLAIALFEESKYEDALGAFDAFLKSHPQSPLVAQAQLGSASSLDELGKTKEAAEAYQQLIQAHPKEPVANLARLNLAALHQANQEWTKAKDLYDEIGRQEADFFQRQLPFAFGGSSLSRTARQLAGMLEDAHPDVFAPKVKFPFTHDQNATVPGGNATAPSGNATRPSGTATRPSGNATAPVGNATAPRGNATAPSANATAKP